MPRCLKHKFKNWIPYGKDNNLKLIELTEKELIQKQEFFIKTKEEFHGRSDWEVEFQHKILWKRKCKNCAHEDTNWLNPIESLRRLYMQRKKK